MPTITLPDGSQRQFANPVTGAEVAAAIGPGLAKAALAVKLNGEVKDLSHLITADVINEFALFRGVFAAGERTIQKLPTPSLHDLGRRAHCVG